MEGGTGLEHGLVNTPTARNDPHHGTALVRDRLPRARRQLDAGLAGIWVLGHDGAVVARGAGDLAAVASHVLEVADHGTLGHLRHGEHVAHSQLRLLAAVDELTSVHALRGSEKLLVELVAVRRAELHDSQRRATSGVMDDVLHDTLDVARALRIVQGAERHRALAVLGVALEDGACTTALRPDAHAHSAQNEASRAAPFLFLAFPAFSKPILREDSLFFCGKKGCGRGKA